MIVSDTTLTCCHKDCGISFAVPKWWEQGKRENQTVAEHQINLLARSPRIGRFGEHLVRHCYANERGDKLDSRAAPGEPDRVWSVLEKRAL
jgi:hypothetical protein